MTTLLMVRNLLKVFSAMGRMKPNAPSSVEYHVTWRFSQP
jgi:hypothetical protein